MRYWPMTLVFLGIYMGQWERVWVLKVICLRFEFQQCDLGQISNNSEPQLPYL